MSKPDYVYIAHDSAKGRVLIGGTVDVDGRMAALRLRYGDGLRLVAVLPAARVSEERLRRVFEQAQSGPRWFRAAAVLPHVASLGDCRLHTVAEQDIRQQRQLLQLFANHERKMREGMGQKRGRRRLLDGATQAHLARRIADRERRNRERKDRQVRRRDDSDE